MTFVSIPYTAKKVLALKPSIYRLHDMIQLVTMLE